MHAVLHLFTQKKEKQFQFKEPSQKVYLFKKSKTLLLAWLNYTSKFYGSKTLKNRIHYVNAKMKCPCAMLNKNNKSMNEF